MLTQWKNLVAILSALPGMAVSALILELDPPARDANAGDVVTFDIVFDPDGDAAIGGGLDVVFEPDALTIIGYEYGTLGQPMFNATPSKGEGRLIGLGIGNFDGLPKRGVVATIMVRVRRDGLTRIDLDDTQSNAGSWPDPIDFGSVFAPDFRSALVASGGVTYPLLRPFTDVTLEPVPVGSSTTADVQVFNDGTGPLAVFGAEFTAGSIGYSIVKDGCTGQSVAARSACRLTVGYTTTQLNSSRQGGGRLVVDAPDELQRDNDMRFVVPIPSPRLSLPLIEFFEARLDPPYRRQRATIENVGEWPATVGDFSVRQFALPPHEFRLSNDGCSGQTLDIGQTCQIEVEFVPAEEGRAIGTYVASYSDGVFESLGDIRGYTPTGIPVIDLDGPQEWDMVAGEQAFRRMTITNKGSRLFRILQAPASDGAFSVIGTNCALHRIAPGDFCFIDLMIHPTQPGPQLWSYVALTDSFYAPTIGFYLKINAVEPP